VSVSTLQELFFLFFFLLFPVPTFILKPLLLLFIPIIPIHNSKILIPKLLMPGLDNTRLFMSLTAGAGTRCMSLLSSSAEQEDEGEEEKNVPHLWIDSTRLMDELSFSSSLGIFSRIIPSFGRRFQTKESSALESIRELG